MIEIHVENKLKYNAEGAKEIARSLRENQEMKSIAQSGMRRVKFIEQKLN